MTPNATRRNASTRARRSLPPWFALFLLVAVSIPVGCRDKQATPSGAGIGDRVPRSGPCAVALSAHLGSDAVDASIRRLQDQVTSAPRAAVHLERLGWTYVAKARASFDPGFYTLAEATALCLESRAPERVEAWLLRGHALHSLHRFEDAERLARRCVAYRGYWFDYALLGDVLLDTGRLDEAVAAYQVMLDQRPGPEAYHRAATVRWLKGDLEGAIDLMRMSVASGGADREAAAWALTRLAGFEFQAGDPSSALERIERALALRPDYPPARLLRGRILLVRGRQDEAVASLRTAARLNPLPEVRWTLIEGLLSTGGTDEAAAVESQLLARGERDDRRTFALYLATVGLEAERAVRLARAELMQRRDVFTLDAMAWALRAAGKPEEAYAFSRRALAEGTRDARLFYHAGVIAAEAGERLDAERLLAAADDLRHLLLPSERRGLDDRRALNRNATPGGSGKPGQIRPS